MKKSRFTETQIVAVLKEAGEGVGGGECASEAPICGHGAGERGDEGPDRKKALKPEGRREAARYLVDRHRVSVRRACDCVGLARSAYYTESVNWLVRDAEVMAALARLVEERPSRGFWKCCQRLRLEGCGWNHKRIYRVYRAMKLNLRRAARRRLPKRERAPLYVPRQPDSVWSADFMADALACGRRFRLFNIVDDFNREVEHIEVDTSITSERLVRVFERLRQERGLPQVLRTDNGPEFLGEAFISWAKAAGMAIQYIQPGKPNQNAYIELFNRTLREELLDANLFLRLDDVREAVYWWQIEYNEQRPHDALGGIPPVIYRMRNTGNSTYELSA